MTQALRARGVVSLGSLGLFVVGCLFEVKYFSWCFTMARPVPLGRFI